LPIGWLHLILPRDRFVARILGRRHRRRRRWAAAASSSSSIMVSGVCVLGAAAASAATRAISSTSLPAACQPAGYLQPAGHTNSDATNRLFAAIPRRQVRNSASGGER